MAEIGHSQLRLGWEQQLEVFRLSYLGASSWSRWVGWEGLWPKIQLGLRTGYQGSVGVCCASVCKQTQSCSLSSWEPLAT